MVYDFHLKVNPSSTNCPTWFFVFVNNNKILLNLNVSKVDRNGVCLIVLKKKNWLSSKVFESLPLVDKHINVRYVKL